LIITDDDHHDSALHQDEYNIIIIVSNVFWPAD